MEEIKNSKKRPPDYFIKKGSTISPGYYNHNLDEYDVLVGGKYYGTLHIVPYRAIYKNPKNREKAEAKARRKTMAVLWAHAHEEFPHLREFPRDMVELKFKYHIN